MKIYIDEEFNACEGRSLRVSRGDLLALDVVLPSSAGTWLEVRFGGKVSYDGDFLVHSFASDVSGEFRLGLNLNTEQLELALGDDDCLVIPCELEFRREGAVQTVKGIRLLVDQDIIKGGEVAPSEIPGVLDISPDGYFVVNGVKTTFIAEPKITVGDNKNLFINGVDSGQRCVAPVVEIGANGNWFEDGVDTGRRAVAQESGIPLFYFVYSDHVVDDVNWVVSEGQWLDGNTYADAYALLLAQFNAGKPKMVDNVSYRDCPNMMRIAALNQSALIDARYAAIGDGWFYLLDTLNKRFKLPRTRNFLRVGETVGEYKQDQIVNITGGVEMVASGDSRLWIETWGGVTKYAPSTTAMTIASSGNTVSNTTKGFLIDASKSVKTGDQVQPRSTNVLLCFRVANRYA